MPVVPICRAWHNEFRLRTRRRSLPTDGSDVPSHQTRGPDTGKKIELPAGRRFELKGWRGPPAVEIDLDQFRGFATTIQLRSSARIYCKAGELKAVRQAAGISVTAGGRPPSGNPTCGPLPFGPLPFAREPPAQPRNPCQPPLAIACRILLLSNSIPPALENSRPSCMSSSLTGYFPGFLAVA